MRKNIKGFTAKFTSALLIAAVMMSTASTVVRADEIDTEPTECVETVDEGQGDVIDDCFAEVEAPAEETPAAPEVEGQGDIIDDEFAVAPEAEVQPTIETVVEAPVVEIPAIPEIEGQGDIIDDEFAVAPEAEVQPVIETVVEAPVEETPAVPEVEGQGDIIDDEFAVSPEEAQRTEEAKKAEEEREKQLEIIVAELNESMKPAVDAMIQARLREETKVETKEEAKKAEEAKNAKNAKAPAVDMSFYHNFLGYHGDRVDYEDLVPGKFYLMQIPGKSKIPSFTFKVVQFNGSYTKDGKVMVKYDKYKTNGKLEARNRKTQANETLAHMKPNHFFEITDDIRA